MNFLKTEYKRTNGAQLKIGCIVERFIFSEQDIQNKTITNYYKLLYKEIAQIAQRD